MAKGFKNGAGGANPLNFKVVGGTTAPANPRENTIWVNTDTAITGWSFSATQPTASEGVVWFNIGMASSAAFSVTKKNPVMVYPLSAKQYVGGKWMSKTAKTYQNGAWAEWAYVITSGGEVLRTMKNVGDGTTTVGSNYVRLETEYDDAAYYYMTSGKHSVSDYSKMVVRFSDLSPVNDDSEIKPFLSTTLSEDGSVAYKSVVNKSSGTIELDISGLQGSYYLGICMYCYDSPNSVRVTDWRLER